MRALRKLHTLSVSCNYNERRINTGDRCIQVYRLFNLRAEMLCRRTLYERKK